MTGETVWVPHYRTKGEKPCEGCSHLESGLVEDDDGKPCLIHICPVNNLIMHYPYRVARCPDWVHGSKRIEKVSK